MAVALWIAIACVRMRFSLREAILFVAYIAFVIAFYAQIAPALIR